MRRALNPAHALRVLLSVGLEPVSSLAPLAVSSRLVFAAALAWACWTASLARLPLVLIPAPASPVH